MNVSQPVIILLLVANLVATLWFGLKKPADYPEKTPENQAAVHQLPDALNATVRNTLYNDFADAFNAKNYDTLYNLLGEAAKAQLEKASALKEFKRLSKYFYAVEKGAFTHSEYAGSKGNTNYYRLHFAVTLSQKSEFGNKGKLKITVAVQGEDYQIYGIRLNSG